MKPIDVVKQDRDAAISEVELLRGQLNAAKAENAQLAAELKRGRELFAGSISHNLSLCSKEGGPCAMHEWLAGAKK